MWFLTVSVLRWSSAAICYVERPCSRSRSTSNLAGGEGEMRGWRSGTVGVCFEQPEDADHPFATPERHRADLQPPVSRRSRPRRRSRRWPGRCRAPSGRTPKHCLALLWLDWSGARVASVDETLVGDYDEPRGRIRLRAAVTKTRKPLWVELPDALADAIEASLPPREDRDPDSSASVTWP